MNEWMTALEIAKARLPDLPSSKRGVAMRAAEERWDEHPVWARKRAKGKGGGIEYYFRLFPTLAQIAFSQRHTVIGKAANDEPAQPVAVAEPVSARAAQERDARLAIVTEFDRFSKGMRLNQTACLKVFIDKYNGGTLKVDAWIKDLVPHLAHRTFMRWKTAKKTGQTGSLAVDHVQRRKGTGVLDRAENGRVLDWMLALIAVQPHLPAREVRRQCRHEFGDTIEVCGKQVPMPPDRTFQHAIARLKVEHHVLLVKLTNPDLYRSTMKPSGRGSLRHITEPNELWMIDASPVDAICTDGRFSIYGNIDIATRRYIITVSETPRSSAVTLMLRRSILKWGKPNVVKTDNGSDFTARDTKRFLDAVDIEISLSDAYSSAAAPSGLA